MGKVVTFSEVKEDQMLNSHQARQLFMKYCFFIAMMM